MNGKQNEANEALRAQRGLWIGLWIGLKLKLAIIPVSINTAPQGTRNTIYIRNQANLLRQLT